MKKNERLTISNWPKGVAESALLGAEMIKGCDILDTPGVLKIGNSASIPTALQTYLTANPTQVLTGYPTAYRKVIVDFGDGEEEIFVTDGGEIFSSRNPSVDWQRMQTGLGRCWDMVGTEMTWDNGGTPVTEFISLVSYTQSGTGYIGVVAHRYASFIWQPGKVGGLTSTGFIKLLKAQDGYIYYTNGDKIGRITAITYNSGTGQFTLTGSTNVLDLKGDYGVSIVELGANLLIGTTKSKSFDSRGSISGANIFPWDRSSSSFRLPVQINENGINAMLQKDNTVYFSAGVNGNIYATDGVNYRKIKRLPFTKMKKFSKASKVYPNAIAVNQSGNLLIGTSTLTDATPNTDTKHGIWEISLTSGYPAQLIHMDTDGDTGQSGRLDIGCIVPAGDSTLYFGLGRLSSFKLLQSSVTAYDGYIATYDSEVFRVGTNTHKASFSQLEFTLAEPLVTGQGIKISYRKNTSGSWTEIGTWTYAELSGVLSHNTKALIADAEIIQFRIQLTQPTNTVYGYNVNLLDIEIW